MAIESKIWTYQLSSTSLTIDGSFDFTVLSILCTAGDVVVTGDLVAGGLPSSPITLSQGQGITLTSGNNNNIVLSNIIVDAAGGVAAISGR